MASLIRYPLPYYAPTPMQSAARFERLRQHGRTREHAQVAAIERAEPHALRALRGSASAARVVRASFASESATDILFLPQMPDAAQLARRTWAAKFYEAHETEAETSAAAAAVRALRDDPAIVAKVVALWKAPSMQKQLAARFKELTSGGTGRDPAKALNKRFSSRAMQQAPVRPQGRMWTTKRRRGSSSLRTLRQRHMSGRCGRAAGRAAGRAHRHSRRHSRCERVATFESSMHLATDNTATEDAGRSSLSVSRSSVSMGLQRLRQCPRRALRSTPNA